MNRIRSLVIYANPQRDRGLACASAAADAARSRGVSVEVAELGCDRSRLEGMIASADMVASFGGDGTLLSVAAAAAAKDVPLLGINLGKLGFMTAFDASDRDAFLRVLDGDYTIDSRMMLSAKVIRDGKTVFTAAALNDAVVTAREQSRTITLEIYCDSHCAARLRGDGVIAATPTGSTAYSLSAGGPVIDPRTECMALTPICAHSPYARPMVLPAADGAEIRIPESAALTMDGQYAFALEGGDRLVVTKDAKCVRLVRLKNDNFYGIMSRKLWQAPVPEEV